MKKKDVEFLTEASFNSNTFLAAMLFSIVQPLHLPDTSGLIKNWHISSSSGPVLVRIRKVAISRLFLAGKNA